MKLFEKFKNIFSVEIALDTSNFKGVVFPFKLKGGKIKLGTKLTVPDNFVFAIATNGKVLDIIQSGTFALTSALLPECCKKLKINKQNQSGNLPKFFKADAYFICLNSINMLAKTFRKAEMGGKASGIFKVGAECNTTIQISDCRLLLENLLMEFAYLKPGEAEDIIAVWNSDIILRCFEKQNFALSEFLAENPIILNQLRIDLAVELNKLGIKLVNIELITFLLPKKYQSSVKQNKPKLQPPNDKNEVAELPTLNKEEQVEFNYVPFGNLVIHETTQCSPDTPSKNQQAKQEQQEMLDKQEKPETAEEITNYAEVCKEDNKPLQEVNNCTEISEKNINIEKNTAQEELHNQEFIDLDPTKLYESKDNFKICKTCGAENYKEREFCILCGEKLKENENG